MRIIALLLLVLVVGCSDATRADYLELSGRVFVFNPREATATYVVTLNISKPVPQGSRIVALFDNPAGGTQLRIEKPILESQSKIALESEPLLCIKKGRPYHFEVVLFGRDNTVLQRIASSITSTLDQSVLPPVPLVVGPGYEPNPALESLEAGQILRDRAKACPP